MAERSRKTMDQRRAAHAWECISTRKNDRDRDDYARRAKKMPMQIRTSGLGHAVAFLQAKARGDVRSAEGKLVTDVKSWLSSAGIMPRDAGGLIDWIIQGDAGQLRHATDEVMAYMQWLNRFAEAEGLPKEG